MFIIKVRRVVYLQEERVGPVIGEEPVGTSRAQLCPTSQPQEWR